MDVSQAFLTFCVLYCCLIRSIYYYHLYYVLLNIVLSGFPKLQESNLSNPCSFSFMDYYICQIAGVLNEIDIDLLTQVK